MSLFITSSAHTYCNSNHIAATHAGTANLCLACGRAMAHASSLARHTRDQHANPDGFPCYLPGCPETFSRQESLGAHLEQKHGEVLREAVDLWGTFSLQ